MSDVLTIKVPALTESKLSDKDRLEIIRFLEEVKKVVNANSARITALEATL